MEDVCGYASKSCVLDCSGRGVCRFTVITSGRTAASCPVNDLSCAAECKCDEGFFGVGCVDSAAQIKTKQNTRFKMIKAVNSTAQFEDPSEERTVSLISLLVLISGNPGELTPSACTILEGLLTSLLVDAR
jgi:hypothetical protein